jgi:hypothetical protein
VSLEVSFIVRELETEHGSELGSEFGSELHRKIAWM